MSGRAPCVLMGSGGGGLRRGVGSGLLGGRRQVLVQLLQRVEAGVRDQAPNELGDPRVTHLRGGGDAVPIAAPGLEKRADLGVKIGAHDRIIAKFCGIGKQHFAIGAAQTADKAASNEADVKRYAKLRTEGRAMSTADLQKALDKAAAECRTLLR